MGRMTDAQDLRSMPDEAPGNAPSEAMPGFLQKITPSAELAAALAGLPRPWVFTNGVFDVLHRGHVLYLAQARALGGSLIVGLNTDASVRRLGKGEDRPLNAEGDRAVVMASQGAVDLVTWFGEDTPEALIALIRPDILVKGGDYDMAKLPETRLVESWGGRAMALPFVSGYSTTALVRKIRTSAA
jgi:rfaE bifunctional protein nucleotidyltransferase chain/domain